jgi:hypothetical protein
MLATARSTAADPAFAAAVNAGDVDAITAQALQQALGSNIEVGLVLCKLLLTGLEARSKMRWHPIEDAPDPATRDELDALCDKAAIAWITAVTIALTHAPDWRRYASARDAGVRVLAPAARRNAVWLIWTHRCSQPNCICSQS